MADWLQIFVGASTNAAIYSLIAFSLVLVYRGSGVVNFGVGYLAIFAGIFFANNGAGGWVALGLTLVVGAALGAGMYLAAVVWGERLGAPHAAIAIATLGFGMVLDYYAGRFWEPQGFTSAPLIRGSTELFDVRITYQRILTVVVALVCLAVVLLLIERTTIGWSLEAVAFRPSTAASYGVNVLVTMVLVWMLAGMVAALGGAMLAPISSVSRPLALVLAIKGFASAVIGGIGSINGAVTGAIVVAFTEALFIRYVSPSYAVAFAFVLLFVVLAIRPQGVVGNRRQVART
jgi:branched-chain amino acid transport system permease protein